jgi:hypothetical protein
MAARRQQARADDGFVRETVAARRDAARVRARAMLDRWPAATWRELPGGEIEFTMKRMRGAE